MAPNRITLWPARVIARPTVIPISPVGMAMQPILLVEVLRTASLTVVDAAAILTRLSRNEEPFQAHVMSECAGMGVLWLSECGCRKGIPLTTGIQNEVH